MITRAIKFIAPKSLLALGLFVLLAATSASAQTQAGDSAVFRVPFEFTAGGVRLPAGEYTIRRMSQTGLAYFVRSRDGRATAAVTIESPLHAKRDARAPRLTFDIYEGQYFLSEVWAAGGQGAELSRPRAVRRAARRAPDVARVSIHALAN